MENNLEAILSSVMSNKELMSKISDVVKEGGSESIGDVVSLISPLVGNESSKKGSSEASMNEKNESKNEHSPDDNEKISNNTPLGRLGGAAGRSISKNKALLLALKPYLSKERGEIIEALIRLSQIAEAVKLI